MNENNNKTSIYIKILTLSTSIIAVFLVINLFVYSGDPATNNTETMLPTFKDSYSIFSLKIPDDLSFAGEPVPVDKHWVKESFDRELLINTYWQSQTVLFVKRSNRYFPIIEPILKEQGVPDDFKYLAVIESGLMPRSVSPAGASGIWQFMSATAKEYGLEVNSEVDERYHLEKATVAACKYLKKAYAKYNNWTLVAASYNAGKRGISNQLDRQKADSYYNLLLGEETGRYVYRILAIKEILSHPVEYGFHVDDNDKYPTIATQTIQIDSTLANIANFAANYGISYKEFKDLNPWLRENNLTNRYKKTYQIALPKGLIKEEKTLAQDNEAAKPISIENKEMKMEKQSLIIKQ
ncbi:lytic transglycosylase domain-containing protein [Plebeiibacterium marinum]|uniref:Lytic transglycosylase domain-containing protein n=1 Tax=Plebeiibacterium marinum TaxID=2992111 RepID=A0AAE3MAU7_9BACT|nr:lytic transglycosylase domain-containing protein [Plebeiobacterium marinum]MCW3804046.1 lytic transglycosylase domain-containing protein [Plebeiobacterium marinum]